MKKSFVLFKCTGAAHENNYIPTSFATGIPKQDMSVRLKAHSHHLRNVFSAIVLRFVQV